MIKELTNAEEEVMQIIWRLKKAFIREIIERFGEPRPAYSTVSTVIRILLDKGFVSFKAYGRTYQYFPLISRDDYRKMLMERYLKDYFSNSFQKMVCFFAIEGKLSVENLEEVAEMVKREQKSRKGRK